jgi:ATP-binding cassette subfamily B protein
VPVLVLPALIVRRIDANMWLRHFRIWAAGLTDNRRSLYWGELVSSPAEAKELRTFGFGPWIMDRRQHHLHAHLDSVWADDLRAVREKWKVLLLAVLPLATVFVVVAVGTARGHGSVALLAGVLGASWGVFTALIGAGDAMNVEGARPTVQAASSLRRQLGGHGATGPDPTTAAHLGREAPPLVRFEGVTFRYPGATSDVLDGLDLEIRPGELLAVVGLNGTGKSTLTKLLAGLYEPDGGRITADGVDLRALGLTGWRRLITIVHQDFVRYALTVRQNVALGKVTAHLPDDVVVQAAARDAGLSPVVDRLADGWDTPLSRSRTGGVDLSGGEWQQVALARALYATRMGARVLVLDEPTAHLDVRTEADLFARLSGITRGVSTILISHRLSTVRQADRIVLLEDGQIRESGTHDELMALGGGYARMFSLQAERFVLGYDDRVPAGALP